MPAGVWPISPMTNSSTATAPGTQVPRPPSERGQWLLALALGTLGMGVLVAVLTGVVGRTTTALPAAVAPPVVVEVAATPVPRAAASASLLGGAAARQGSVAGSNTGSSHTARHGGSAGRSHRAAQPSPAQQQLVARRFVDQTEAAIPTRWMEGFYPIYPRRRARSASTGF